MALGPMTQEDAYATGTVSKTTLSSSGTLEASCYKKDNVVSVGGRIHSLPWTTIASGDYFEIPSGFRPPTDVKCYGFMRVADNTSGTNKVFMPFLATITTAGKLNMSYSSSWYTDQVGFTASYKV